ncbi:His-Me finger endonuclease [Rhizophagus irregularis]|uniref:His-Me finger endonuclease n=1 Tax=Rhizophagus irregularis TaxID=588596 RepID=A0A2I1HLE0_9GLOM|nr:His-Me finger endonuclease [Rhizophagus irregularis]
MAKIIIEVWLPITYSDKLVSNLGRVKNKKGTILRLSVCKRSGYIQMVFKINDVYKNIAIHTLVAQAFIPNPKNKPFINHKNGIRHDNRVASRAKDIEWTGCSERNSNEKWREIELNSRKFRVSSLGRVQFPNGLISQGSLNAGYLRIAREKHCVHRLIALAFCPKGRGKEYVNHIDGNRTNNKASNLEWCTQKENSQHAIQLGLWGNCNQHAVKQIFDDNSTQEFPSLTEAQRITGIHRSCIWRVCQGLQNHAGACRWEYVSTISHNNHEDSSQ